MSTVKGFGFDPLALLNLYRQRASQSINVFRKNAAFKSSDGKPITRVFMVSCAEKLREAAVIEILNFFGAPIKVSQRFGVQDSLCLHAKQVRCDVISSNGRWTSVGGPMLYTMDTLNIYQQMTRSLVTSHTKRTLKGVGSFGPGAGGHFVSSSQLL